MLLSIASGIVHERGPVFAALYGNPILILGIPYVWWGKSAPPDGDSFVGLPGLGAVVERHRKVQAWLDWRQLVMPTRALIPLAAWVGVSPHAWLALLVATAVRLVGTENARFVMWGALPIVAELHDVPAWIVAAHALTFQRIN